MYYENEVYIYLRKSRSDDPDMSVEEILRRHENILQEYALKEFGFTIPEAQIFREIVSGETIDDRPMMLNLIRLLESDQSIKAVLIVEPQRLSRGDLMDCGRIINTFRYTSTAVITPTHTYNVMDEYDRKFLEMELMRGNDYLEYTKKILMRGRLASVRSGQYICSVRPYGYQKISYTENKKKIYTLEPIPEEANVVKTIFLMYKEGKGCQTISKHLEAIGIPTPKGNHWSPSSINCMLTNPIYIGIIRWNERKVIKSIEDGKIVKSRPRHRGQGDDLIMVQGLHPAIIDEDLFYEVQNLIGSTPKVKRSSHLSNPFAGLLFCKACGKAMSQKKYTQHSRTGHVTISMVCNEQRYCHTKSCMYAAIVDKVIDSMKNTIHDFEIKMADENLQSELLIRENTMEMLKIEIKKLHDKDTRQKDAYEDGTYTKTEYLQRNTKLQEQLVKLQAQLKGLESTTLPKIDYEEKILRFSHALEALQDESVSAEEKNLLLKKCIKRIEYTNHSESKAGIGRHVDNPFELDIFFYL